MTRDRLFEIGVFDDDDVPPPKAGPVQNLDETTAVKVAARCERCDTLLVDDEKICGPCNRQLNAQAYKRTKRRKKALEDQNMRAKLEVQRIVGNLCQHCGIRRRQHLSRTCGQRSCSERHE